MSSRYPIPAGRVRVEDEIKHSRFITTIARAHSAGEASDFIEEMCREFPDANHNCWAFVAGPPGSLDEAGSSDDGEPGGTAGRPMLGILLRSGVGEIVAVVTRYFGGVKLGRGGLMRAYSGAVRHALRELERAEYVERVAVDIELPYAQVDPVKRLLTNFDARSLDETFAEAATLRVSVPVSLLEDFEDAVRDATGGGARLTREKT